MASSCLLIVVYLSLLISHFATTTSLPFCDSNQLGQALIKILHQSVPTHFDLKLTEEEVAFYRYHFDYYCNHFATMTTGIVVQNCLLITLEIKRLAYYPLKMYDFFNFLGPLSMKTAKKFHFLSRKTFV